MNFGQLKSEVFHFRVGGGYSGVNFGQIKSEVFHWGGGGGGTLEPNSRTGVFWSILTQILLFEVTVHKPACASQIVSHILRMWRLKNAGMN